jgi:dTDP-glucose 4,6-dehydratase
LKSSDESILNIDKLTYAANLDNLSSVQHNKNYQFIQADINQGEIIADVLHRFQPRAVIHFAAESHVDRSITGPADFIQTNILGTFHLLEQSRAYWNQLSPDNKNRFRYVQISTDEVFGSLNQMDAAFSETTPFAPNSPYSASKAGADHLVRSYYHTYGFPVLTTHCSNNYGPHQFDEKLIPQIILNALSNKHLPIYGDGLNIRDWLYVTDHCHAINTILEKGKPGETYNIGGNSEKTNLEVVYKICDLLDKKIPKEKSYREQIKFVQDRPGHDKRYAIDASKIHHDLLWSPQESFETGIEKTLEWYLNKWKSS